MAAGKSGSIWASLGLTTKDFEKGIKRVQGQMKSFGSDIVKNTAGILAGAFAVDSLITFGKEADELAGKMKGVEGAFKKINNGNLLDDLRKATKGTVSDLKLMQMSVSAKNLGLPVKQLATYFEFARRRAKETGESVDYLVDSIVKGIGRKSPLILDNLGISTSALNAELKKTGDFGQAAGNIIEREMGNMAADVDTSVESSAKLAAQWENFKTRVGSGFVGDIFAGLGELGSGLLELITPSQEVTEQFFEMKKEVDDLNSNVQPLLGRYDELSQKSNLTTKEQDELKKIVKKVSETIPEAITEFDKYGNAMKISTGIAGDFIENQKLMLKIKNADAIQSEAEQINRLKKQYDKLKATLEGTAGGYANIKRENGVIFEFQKGIDKFDKGMWIEVTDGVQKYQNKLKETYSQLKGHILVYKELNGETIKVKEKEEEITKELSQDQLKALEDRKKKLKETYEEAEKVNKNLAAGFGLIDGSDLVVDLSGLEVKNGDDFWDFTDDLEPPNMDMAMDEALSSTKTKMDKMREMMMASSQAIYDALQDITVQGIATIGAAMGTAMAGGDFGGIILGFAQMIGGAVSSLGQQLITLGIAELAIMDALKTFGASNPALVIAGGAALVAIGAAMKSNMSQSVGFADGGLVTGSVFANIGEGIGTNSANPEVIAPLDKLKNFIDPQQNAGMGGNVSFRIEGNTLVGILDRQAKTTKYGR